MAQPHTSIRLTSHATRGQGGVLLTDGTNYALTEGGWAPGVAPRSRAAYAGRDLYDPTVETITVNVLGATTAQTLANLATLSQLLDQAEAFMAGEPVAPVRLEIWPQGSTTAAPSAALVIGRAQGSLLDLPQTFADLLMVNEVPQVTIRIARRGTWLGPPESVTGTAQSGELRQQLTWPTGATAIPSPMRVQIDGVPETTTFRPGFLVIGTAEGTPPSTLRISSAVGGNPGGVYPAGWAAVSETGTGAQDNQILRYTANDVTWSDWINIGVGTFGANHIQILTTIRNNVAGATWELQPRIGLQGYMGSRQILPLTTIPGNSGTYPQAIALSDAYLPYDPLTTVPDCLIEVRVRLASAAHIGATLDLERVAAVSLDTVQTRILAIDPFTTGSTTGSTQSLVIDPQPLTALAPTVQRVNGPTRTAVSATGDPYLLTTAATVHLWWLAPIANRWRIGAGALNATITRWPAALTPV